MKIYNKKFKIYQSLYNFGRERERERERERRERERERERERLLLEENIVEPRLFTKIGFILLLIQVDLIHIYNGDLHSWNSIYYI